MIFSWQVNGDNAYLSVVASVESHPGQLFFFPRKERAVLGVVDLFVLPYLSTSWLAHAYSQCPKKGKMEERMRVNQNEGKIGERSKNEKKREKEGRKE